MQRALSVERSWMSTRSHQKSVIVTGAGRGIGKEIAKSAARNGARVCFVSRSQRDLNHVVSAVKKDGGTGIGVMADVSSEDDVKRIVSSTREAFHRIDGLVCVAGYPMIEKLWNTNVHRLTEKDLLDVFKTDVLGSFLLVKEVLPIMMKQRSGVIILFSSTPAISGYDKGGAYVVSKTAILGLMKSIAAEYGRYNIRAYAIAPGNIKTKRTFAHLPKSERTELEQESAMKRWGEPSEVAKVALSLLSSDMSFVTGQTIVVDGGTVML